MLPNLTQALAEYCGCKLYRQSGIDGTADIPAELCEEHSERLFVPFLCDPDRLRRLNTNDGRAAITKQPLKTSKSYEDEIGYVFQINHTRPPLLPLDQPVHASFVVDLSKDFKPEGKFVDYGLTVLVKLRNYLDNNFERPKLPNMNEDTVCIAWGSCVWGTRYNRGGFQNHRVYVVVRCEVFRDLVYELLNGRISGLTLVKYNSTEYTARCHRLVRTSEDPRSIEKKCLTDARKNANAAAMLQTSKHVRPQQASGVLPPNDPGLVGFRNMDLAKEREKEDKTCEREAEFQRLKEKEESRQKRLATNLDKLDKLGVPELKGKTTGRQPQTARLGRARPAVQPSPALPQRPAKPAPPPAPRVSPDALGSKRVPHHEKKEEDEIPLRVVVKTEPTDHILHEEEPLQTGSMAPAAVRRSPVLRPPQQVSNSAGPAPMGYFGETGLRPAHYGAGHHLPQVQPQPVNYAMSPSYHGYNGYQVVTLPASYDPAPTYGWQLPRNLASSPWSIRGNTLFEPINVQVAAIPQGHQSNSTYTGQQQHATPIRPAYGANPSACPNKRDASDSAEVQERKRRKSVVVNQ